MQPSSNPPLPVAQVDVGMEVVDSSGEGVGKVIAVQVPGTDVRPDLPAGEAEHLMATGYFRVDGGGLGGIDFYASSADIADVSTTGDDGVVTLSGRKQDLPRAE